MNGGVDFVGRTKWLLRSWDTRLYEVGQLIPSIWWIVWEQTRTSLFLKIGLIGSGVLRGRRIRFIVA